MMCEWVSARRRGVVARWGAKKAAVFAVEL